MPIIRNTPQSQITTPEVQTQQFANEAVQPRIERERDMSKGAKSGFFKDLITSAAAVGEKVLQTKNNAAILQGQQDALSGKEREDESWFTQDAYNKGYGQVKAQSEITAHKIEIQNTAQQFANEGKSPSEWEAKRQELNEQLITKLQDSSYELSLEQQQRIADDLVSAGAQAEVNYNKASQETLKNNQVRLVTTSMNENINRIQTGYTTNSKDVTIASIGALFDGIESNTAFSQEQRNNLKQQAAYGLLENAESPEQLAFYRSELAKRPEYKAMAPSDQMKYNNFATSIANNLLKKEQGKVYDYVDTAINGNEGITVSQASDTLGVYRARGVINARQQYAFLDKIRRSSKLQNKANSANELVLSSTTDTYMVQTGSTSDKAKTDVTKAYVNKYQSTSLAAGGLIRDGISLNDQRRVEAGQSLLEPLLENATTIDWSKVKVDPETGRPQINKDVNDALNLSYSLYKDLQSKNYTSQAASLLSGFPKPIRKAFQDETTNGENLVTNVQAAFRKDVQGITEAPTSIPNAVRTTVDENEDDLNYGTFDFGLGDESRFKQIVGIRASLFSSDADDEAKQRRLSQLRPIEDKIYNRMRNAGKLDGLADNSIKQVIRDEMTKGIIRIDGKEPDYGIIVDTTSMKPKQLQDNYGTDNRELLNNAFSTVGEKLTEKFPQAESMSFTIDETSGATKVYLYDKYGVPMGVPQTVPNETIADNVTGRQMELKTEANNTQKVSLPLPNALPLYISTENKAGLDEEDYLDILSYGISSGTAGEFEEGINQGALQDNRKVVDEYRDKLNEGFVKSSRNISKLKVRYPETIRISILKHQSVAYSASDTEGEIFKDAVDRVSKGELPATVLGGYDLNTFNETHTQNLKKLLGVMYDYNTNN